MASADVLDPERVAMLRELDSGDGLLAMIADEYDQDADRQLTTLRTALADSDSAGFERAAHTLKGASMNLGAVELGECCHRLEVMGRAEDLSDVGSLVDAVEVELRRVQVELRRVIAEA